MNTKRLLIIISLIIILIIAGFFSIQYGEEQEVIPENSFLLNVEELVDGNGLLVKQFHIVAHGKRTIKYTEPDGHSEIVVDANEQTGLMNASLTIVADLISFQNNENSYFTYLAQLKARGVTAGGPSRYTLQIDSLSEILTVEVEAGDYPLGEQIQIGTLQDEPMYLVVQ